MAHFVQTFSEASKRPMAPHKSASPAGCVRHHPPSGADHVHEQPVFISAIAPTSSCLPLAPKFGRYFIWDPQSSPEPLPQGIFSSGGVLSRLPGKYPRPFGQTLERGKKEFCIYYKISRLLVAMGCLLPGSVVVAWARHLSRALLVASPLLLGSSRSPASQPRNA